jgi:hypothetical protein
MSSPFLAALATLALFTVSASTAPAQSQKQATGSISGLVTLEGKPAASVHVSLHPGDWTGEDRPVARTTTDREGRYSLSGLASGRYRVTAYAAGYVLSSPGEAWRPGKQVTLAEGESAEGVDLALARGGVVTGRVTDATGRAVVAQRVRLERLGENGQRAEVSFANHYASSTDDRGVYRLFGVPAGRYLVSVGLDEAEGGRIASGQGAFYPKTYHPAAADAQGATLVEVAAGSEATGVDVVVSMPGRTYRVFGRVVEAESGKPMPDVGLVYGPVMADRDGREWLRMIHGGPRTDAKGEFQLADFSPGRYGVALAHFGPTRSDRYADVAVFTVSGADVTGVEVRTRPGATLSGTAVVEGAPDPAAAREALPKLMVFAGLKDDGGEGVRTQASPSQRFESDGSFRLTGLRPGEYSVQVGNFRGPKGYSLLRVERDGAEVIGRISVAEGESIPGLRIVIGYGTGAIRGHVALENGALPESAQLWVSCRRVGEESYRGGVRADARRQFLIEGLVPGEYEVVVMAADPSGSGKPKRTTKVVSVTNDATAEVAIALDLAPEEEGGGE